MWHQQQQQSPPIRHCCSILHMIYDRVRSSMKDDDHHHRHGRYNHRPPSHRTTAYRRMWGQRFVMIQRLLILLSIIIMMMMMTVDCTTTSRHSYSSRHAVYEDTTTANTDNETATKASIVTSSSLINKKDTIATSMTKRRFLVQNLPIDIDDEHPTSHLRLVSSISWSLPKRISFRLPQTRWKYTLPMSFNDGRSKRNRRKSTMSHTNTHSMTNTYHETAWWTAALSGSIAGAVATTLLYPLDAAKTLRQANLASYTTTASTTAVTLTNTIPPPPPQQIASVVDALRHLIQQRTVYVGLTTAILGAIPSSALYFGAYETSKAVLGRTFIHRRRHGHLVDTEQLSLENEVTILQRCLWHSTSAAIGNLISSAVFVPKEVIKQQMQYSGTGTSNVLRTIQHIVTEKGIKNGLYIGYRATVFRNIPSAALRFTFYEELKRYINRNGNNDDGNTWKLYIAGAMAGAMASGIMTPMDLIKTKLSTGTCPVNEVQGCIQYVIEQNGITALWTGAGSRMISSALFSAIGFGTFETCQHYLNHRFNNRPMKHK